MPYIQQIEQVRRRLDFLYDCVDTGQKKPDEVTSDALEELAVSLEELETADDELRQQNEQLAIALRAVEAERRRYKELFDAAPDGYIVTDMNGVIRHVNDAAGQLLNAPARFLSGKPITLYIAREEHRQFRKRLTQAKQDREAISWELRIQPRGKAPIDVAARIAIVHDDEQINVGIRWLLRDITERKQAEQQIRLLNAGLEQRVRERTEQLEQAMEIQNDLLAQEQAARVAAERAGSRLALLAEAGDLLASSFDCEITLTAVARLLVRGTAECCIICVADEDGAICQKAWAHRDSSMEEELALLAGRNRFLMNDEQSPLADVFRTGEMLAQSVNDHDSILGNSSPDDSFSGDSFSGDSTGRTVAEHTVGGNPGPGALFGSIPWRSLLAVPLVARGEVIGVMAIITNDGEAFHDDTQQLARDLAHRMAQAVDNARLFEQARKEIEERRRVSDELQEAKDAAERASRAKDQFLAVLSHELRTPLTAVLGAVSTLRQESGLSEQYRPMVELIGRNMELEARLIDDLLDLTRVIKGKLPLHREVVDLHQLLRNVITICREDITQRGLDLSFRAEARQHHVDGDPVRLQQVFWNLLKNAMKFTPEGGKIVVRTANEKVGELVVEVIDNGIGLEPELIPRIFDAFEQGGEGITRRFGGLGLGLAISKALIDQHGGTIQVASTGPGRGAAFMVKLGTVRKKKEGESGGDGWLHPPEHTMKQLRILLVEDHLDTSRVLTLLLAQRGYKVTPVHSMREALDAVAREEFDILISDIGLPDGSGLDVMRAIRAIHPLRGIALSGFGMEEDIKRSLDVGFAEHLIKPISTNRLLEAIQRLV